MKTSSKLILSAILIMLIAAALYDLQLKKVFDSGEYKQKYKGYISLNFKDFNTIHLNSSTAINILIRQGPFSVKVEPNSNEFVKLTQTGKTLNINAAFSGSFQSYYNQSYVLLITCPSLIRIHADAKYIAGSQQLIDTLASGDFTWRPTLISGFTLDSLTIIEDHASCIVLSNNQIKNINAIVGLSNGSRSNLLLDKDNQIHQANIQLLNKSQLWLHDIVIPQLKYLAADSSKLILTGAAQKVTH